MGGPRSLEAPWDRLDFQDQQAIEAYCSDLERILSMSNDGQSFAEHVAAMDQRFQEAWFTAKFGDPNADPMQAYRTPPTAGVVHPRQSSGSSISAQGSEILQRHASLLEGRFARPHAVPAAAGPPPREVSVPREVREAREAREAGSGAFTRNLASAAGPSRYASQAISAASPRVGRQDFFRRCGYCGAPVAQDVAFCSHCGYQVEAADWRSAWPRPPPPRV
ncbi:unnamed protein product [Cladocopium goreaui]|uniref:Putative zinc-ribbon domain-containing protein n=1 Tax=Cladocopium goreaui TaxID=2562237 RepID=A0A9P1CVG5_9DINO|nr:unnamed protein product [Cladocopium goreaui]